MQHSKVVGGSTAKRVIHCPGSVALVAKMPPQPSSKYAQEGTILHACMEELLADGELGDVIARHGLTPDQGEKLSYCLRALDEIDPKQEMTFVQEVEVEFEGVKALEGVFGLPTAQIKGDPDLAYIYRIDSGRHRIQLHLLHHCTPVD